MEKILEGKTAIVTGSGQGVGRCIALCLAEYGCKVVTNNRKPGSSLNAFEGQALDFNEEERAELEKFSGDARTTADAILAAGGDAIPVFGNVADPEDAKRMVETAVKHWGRIDIIVNNASSNWVGNIMDMDLELWNTQINSKLNGTFHLMYYAMPYMRAHGYGRILNSASDAYAGISSHAAYGAGNAGVVALTKAAAKDLKGTGITVNSYTPLARTRSWFNARTRYRLNGIPGTVIEDNAPESMKHTAEGMVPFLAYLASEYGAEITGLNFKLAADGTVGLWNNPEVIKEVQKEDGFWTMEDLEAKIKGDLLLGLEAKNDILR